MGAASLTTPSSVSRALAGCATVPGKDGVENKADEPGKMAENTGSADKRNLLQGETRESRSEGIVDCGSGPAIKTQIRSKSRRGRRKRSKKSFIPVKQAGGEVVEGRGISRIPPLQLPKYLSSIYQVLLKMM